VREREREREKRNRMYEKNTPYIEETPLTFTDIPALYAANGTFVFLCFFLSDKKKHSLPPLLFILFSLFASLLFLFLFSLV
jgi:hypothetical protein